MHTLAHDFFQQKHSNGYGVFRTELEKSGTLNQRPRLHIPGRVRLVPGQMDAGKDIPIAKNKVQIYLLEQQPHPGIFLYQKIVSSFANKIVKKLGKTACISWENRINGIDIFEHLFYR
jgi:hypothetical protein